MMCRPAKGVGVPGIRGPPMPEDQIYNFHVELSLVRPGTKSSQILLGKTQARNGGEGVASSRDLQRQSRHAGITGNPITSVGR